MPSRSRWHQGRPLKAKQGTGMAEVDKLVSFNEALRCVLYPER